MIFTPLQALLAILFELVLGAKFGITGIVSGLIISFLCTVSWALPYYSYKRKK
jgi:ABC-type thiamin/hydroxymethylpyrimidine transport system permease subunit